MQKSYMSHAIADCDTCRNLLCFSWKLWFTKEKITSMLRGQNDC